MNGTVSLSWLNRDPYFIEIFERLTKDNDLSFDEYSYILGCAILFLNEYSRDKRKTTNFEFSYYIILKYCLKTNDYEPLFDLSTNFGFYPISKYIIENKLISSDNLQSFLINNQLEQFAHNGITETLEQNKFRKEITVSKQKNNSYVAPTSFGKSSLIINIIDSVESNKIGVIVPTKSLLTQTYRMLTKHFPEKKIIFHDEMYDGEIKFIAVFTQERALRLLKDNPIYFDTLLIDEAHNIFDSSSRSILLSRLIRKNNFRNKNSNVYYFSPLITDSENLKTDSEQEIFSREIKFNIKEPDIYEYRLDDRSYLYNRFVNDFYPLKKYSAYTDYIVQNQLNKNFIYLRSPRKVEELASILANNLEYINNDDLQSLSEIISKNVHDEFYCVDYVKKGVLYLHGKLPDLVKEYLEYKFKTNLDLKFVVANSVILEGVNLPIDNLFILNTYSLGGKELTNLIGRVNRLNEVFSGSGNTLKKLIPKVHFVNSEYFNRQNSNMKNKIELLRSRFFKDEIKNPTLVAFDFDNFHDSIETATDIDIHNLEQIKLNKALSIKEREDFLVNYSDLPENKFKAAFLEAGLFSVYKNPEFVLDAIEKRRDSLINQPNWSTIDILTKVYHFFIEEFVEDELLDSSFARLKNEKARSFYTVFVSNMHILTLKEHIDNIVRYFRSIQNDPRGREFYIGSSYGEIAKEGYSGQKLYLNLNNKTHKELVNIALIKIKIESDFVSYTLNQYVSLLKELDAISDNEYDKFIYGTISKRNAKFIKLGLSGALVFKLEKDNQLDNLVIDEMGHVNVNDDFKYYLHNQDDLVRFEIFKYLII